MSGQKQDESDECSVCGWRCLEAVADMLPTGVTSPDGGLEWRWFEGVRCRHCGAVEER